MITNKKIVKEIFHAGECVDIQITPSPNPMSEHILFVDPRAITEEELEKRILEKFGLRDWTKVSVEGCVDTYVPSDIADEFKENKETLMEYLRMRGLY